mmetsp:Transcript_5124/g.14440  ORF Transcript_5124/g.14440 Transcript_5124/m.14440 type:complete len:262 (+) Transcript_5124:373-1158(+)
MLESSLACRASSAPKIAGVTELAPGSAAGVASAFSSSATRPSGRSSRSAAGAARPTGSARGIEQRSRRSCAPDSGRSGPLRRQSPAEVATRMVPSGVSANCRGTPSLPPSQEPSSAAGPTWSGNPASKRSRAPPGTTRQSPGADAARRGAPSAGWPDLRRGRTKSSCLCGGVPHSQKIRGCPSSSRPSMAPTQKSGRAPERMVPSFLRRSRSPGNGTATDLGATTKAPVAIASASSQPPIAPRKRHHCGSGNLLMSPPASV